MSWRDQLRDASFRGVPFLVTGDDLTTGRRVVEHEHPQTDGVTTEDLGGQAPRYSVEAFLLGADYHAARDRLIAALTQEGPGTLVHPHYGERLVQVPKDGVRVRHSTSEGGYVSLSLTFVEVSADSTRPVRAVDTTSAVLVAADAGDVGEIAWFGARVEPEVAAAPGWVLDDAIVRLHGGLDLVTAQMARIQDIQSTIAGAIGEVHALQARALGLLRRPGDLAHGLLGLFASLLRPGSAAGTQALIGLTGSVAVRLMPDAPVTTATRRRQRVIQESVAGLMTRGLLHATARAAATATYETRDDAQAVRNRLAEAMDEALYTAPDEVYGSLTRLRAATIRDLDTRSADLAVLSRYAPLATRPSLVIANDLYGDQPDTVLSMAEDLTRRNAIAHPAFIPAGAALDVLGRSR